MNSFPPSLSLFQLKQQGYSNVLLLEKSSDCGGKSQTRYYPELTGDMPHDLFPALISPSHRRTLDLIKEFNLETVPLVPSIFSPEAASARGISPAPKHRFSVNEYVTGTDEVQSFSKTCWYLPGVGAPPTIRALLRYVTLHRTILGDYEYGLPPEPDASKLRMLNYTIAQFLEKHNLEAMAEFVRFYFVSFGLGLTLEETPAFYLLRFVCFLFCFVCLLLSHARLSLSLLFSQLHSPMYYWSPL